jgi:hypothetical protein
VCQGSASISDGVMGTDGIEYAMTDRASPGMNEAVFVKADDRMLYFRTLGGPLGVSICLCSFHRHSNTPR